MKAPRATLSIRILRFADYERTQIARPKLMGKYSKGKVFDIGYAQLPNLCFSSQYFLQPTIDGTKALVERLRIETRKSAKEFTGHKTYEREWVKDEKEGDPCWFRWGDMGFNRALG